MSTQRVIWNQGTMLQAGSCRWFIPLH